ncbi:MAG: DUF4175 domain-containing protein [Gemmatimonadaceae bacterium]|jgi:hypothetical protein|nr:DUF4175 domain-containing protein [Gemmatimonadaceae bacterium]
MTALTRLGRVRAEWTAALMARFIAWFALAGCAGSAINYWWQGSETVPRGFIVSGLLILIAGIALLWRWRASRDRVALALWIEGRAPALQYALLTRAEGASDSMVDVLEAQIARVPFERLVRPAIWRPLVPLVATVVVATVLMRTMPQWASLRRTGAVRIYGPSEGRAPSTARSALATVRITVAPPPYTRLRTASLTDAARVSAVVGSRVLVEGAAGDDAVIARLGTDPLSISTASTAWSATLRMPARPTLVTLSSGSRQRAVLLEPVIDSVPEIALRFPARDTVLRVAAGVVPLSAVVRDDFGVAAAWFEVVVSAGEGENFTFRTTTLARRTGLDMRTLTLSASLSLDSLALQPGDLVHVRAVARDGNTVTGPGQSGSDTRAIRIARENEYDSVAVDGAPPPDRLKGLLSQRMLIQLAEALEKRRRTLAREPFVQESQRIARDQNALRRQVGDIVFQRLEDLGAGGEHSHDDGHDHSLMTPAQLLAEAREATTQTGEALDFHGGESPVVAISRPLLEAYNAMWEAGSALSIGDPKSALPHMRAALDAIQRARFAERIYLRGRPKEIVVDLAKVRLAGKTDRIGPGARTARDDEDAPRLARLARFDAALARLASDRDAALLALLTLRAELLAAPGAAAAALGDAADLLRSGRDATDALIAARRALAGPAPVLRPVDAWSVHP